MRFKYSLPFKERIYNWWCARIRKQRNWCRWFAWYPVKVDDGICCWLEYVEKKNTLFNYGCYESYAPEYRLIKELSL